MGALHVDRRMDCEQRGVAGGPSDREIGLRRRTRDEVCLEGFSEEVGTALGEVRVRASVFVSGLGRAEANEAGSPVFSGAVSRLHCCCLGLEGRAWTTLGAQPGMGAVSLGRQSEGPRLPTPRHQYTPHH